MDLIKLLLYSIYVAQILNTKSEVQMFRVFDGESVNYRLLLYANSDTGYSLINDLTPQSTTNHVLIHTQVNVMDNRRQNEGDLWTLFWKTNTPGKTC